MTREEFIERYKKNSGMNSKEMFEFMKRQIAVPCDCDNKICKGWKMINKNKNDTRTEPII